LSITDRIDPKGYEDLEEFLLAHEIKNIAMKRLIEFVKRVKSNSCCLDCNRCLACDALDLLRELGEDE
jgi:hypothetical protein